MTRLANEVRLACQLVSHKVRFESGAPLPPHQLSVLFKLRRGSMTKTLAALESQELVERCGDPGDGRRRIISITPTGEAALRDAATVRDSFMENLLATLSDDERATLAEAARILRRVLE